MGGESGGAGPLNDTVLVVFRQATCWFLLLIILSRSVLCYRIIRLQSSTQKGTQTIHSTANNRSTTYLYHSRYAVEAGPTSRLVMSSGSPVGLASNPTPFASHRTFIAWSPKPTTMSKLEAKATPNPCQRGHRLTKKITRHPDLSDQCLLPASSLPSRVQPHIKPHISLY